MKKKFFSILLVMLSLLSVSCSNKIVLNNVFIYTVNPNDYIYGYFGVSGDEKSNEYSYQSVFVGEYSKEVTAYVTANGQKAGYVFVSWSDGNTNPTRKDLAIQENADSPIVFYAHFEKVAW